MPVFKARQLCPGVILTPVRFHVYRAESEKIRSIFARYTELIQPLSLDEAYLDVSHRAESGAALAKEIRRAIFEKTGLTASAGIAPNKMLAKVASDWNKPDGQLEVRPQDVDGFMKGLRVEKLQEWKKDAKRWRSWESILWRSPAVSKVEMAEKLGRWGLELYERCRGRDDREVSVDRTRKSLSRRDLPGKHR